MLYIYQIYCARIASNPNKKKIFGKYKILIIYTFNFSSEYYIIIEKNKFSAKPEMLLLLHFDKKIIFYR